MRSLTSDLYGKKIQQPVNDFNKKIKKAVVETNKENTKKTTKPKTTQPKLTQQQILALQKKKLLEQAELNKKNKPKTTNQKTPKVPYGTKGYLVNAKGENLPRVVNPIAAGLTKVATFGLSSLLPGMKEAEQQAQTQFPIAYTAGQVLGYASPTGLAKGITKGLVKGATKKVASQIGKNVIEGGIIGTGAEATQLVKPLFTGEITPQQAGKQLATGLVAGAGIDVGIGLIGKLAKPIADKLLSGKALTEAEKIVVSKTAKVPVSEVDNVISRELDATKLKGIATEMEQPIVKPLIKQNVEPLIKPISQTTEPTTQLVKPLAYEDIVKPIKPIIEEPAQFKGAIAEQVAPIKETTTVKLEPSTTQEGLKFRKTVKNSLMKSELPDELKDAFEKEPSMYAQVNNEEDWGKAFAKVENDYNGTKQSLNAKESLNSADDTMEYIALINKSAKSNIAEAKKLTEELAEKATRSGQSIQAIIALQKTTPEGQLYKAVKVVKDAEKELEKLNPTLSNEYKTAKKEIEKAIKENAPLTDVQKLAEKFELKTKVKEGSTYDDLLVALKKKYEIPDLTDAEAKEIIDLMEQANKLEGREQEMLFAKVDQLIADKVPTSVFDKVKALRNMSLLGNVKTIGIRNPLGNLVFTGLENVAQIPSGITDKMVSAVLKTPRTTKVFPSLKTQASGFKKGVSEAWEDILNNVDTSPTRGGAELPRNRKIFETAWLNKANNWLGDALKMGDRPFYQAAYDSRLAELKALQPNADVKDLEKLAKEFGLERTFQNQSNTAKALQEIKRGMNKIVGVKTGKLNQFGEMERFGLGDIVMPFSQTPANILEKGVQYTPLNIINVFGKLGGQALGKETIRNNPKAFADAVGRSFTGTGAIALGYKLASDGMITGSQKEDSTKEKAIKKQVGEQQYSVKIGDKWYSFDWAQPASIPLAIGADMYLSGVDKDTALEKIQAGVVSGIDTVFNQSMMQGVSRMFGGTSVTTGVAETLAGAPSQFIPTLSSQVAQQGDVYKRDVDYSNIPKQIKTTAMKKIPGLRQQLPATLDLFGQPIKEHSDAGTLQKAIRIFISPSNVSSETSDKLSKMLYNLYKRTGETDVIPSKMPTGLTKEQEYKFKQVFGNQVKNRLEQVTGSNFDSLSDDAKVRIIRKEIDNAYEYAKDNLGIGKK